MKFLAQSEKFWHKNEKSGTLFDQTDTTQKTENAYSFPIRLKEHSPSELKNRFGKILRGDTHLPLHQKEQGEAFV